MQCPVIHRITDNSPFPSGQCPFGHNDAGLGDIPLPDRLTEGSYKKLRKVMTQITQFYENGTNLKRTHYEQMGAEIAKLDVDREMCERQLQALESTPAIREHPKAKTYRERLLAEKERFGDQRSAFEKKQKEFYDLWQWSTVIVKVCHWLLNSLDAHCKEKLGINIEVEALPPLSPADVEAYSKGLDEISYNLQESQDFFKASVDGRLQQYHEVERAVIACQMEVLGVYPVENARRMHWEGELNEDLEYVNGLLSDDVEKTSRRQKMLTNHAAFLAVLKYHKEKLSHPFKSDPSRTYDPKYDFNPAAVIAEHGSA
jgi:hypothetical protein